MVKQSDVGRRRVSTSGSATTKTTTEDDSSPAPPLYIKCAGVEWLELFDNMKQHCKEEVAVESIDSGDIIKLQAASSSDHEALRELVAAHVTDAPQQSATDNKIRRDKTIKALLRGLPWAMSEKAVREGLKREGLVNAAVKLHNKSNKKKPPLFVVAIPAASTDGGGDIFTIKKLLGFPVKTEPLPPHLDTKPQCFKCQGEGHVAKYCRNVARCVKCGGQHDSRTCAISNEEDPTCARCGGPHVASWRGCRAFVPNIDEGAKESHGPRTKKRRRRRRRKPAGPPPAALREARSTPPPTGDRGGGGGRRGEPTGCLPQLARSSTTNNIDAALAEAEARFRMALHAEMEAACLLFRETWGPRLRKTEPLASRSSTTSATAATQTEVHAVTTISSATQTSDRTEKPNKRMVVNRAIQATEDTSPPLTVQVNQGSQTSTKRNKRSIKTQTEWGAGETPTTGQSPRSTTQSSKQTSNSPRTPSPEVEDLGLLSPVFAAENERYLIQQPARRDQPPPHSNECARNKKWKTRKFLH